MPLVLINLDAQHNKLRLFYEDAGHALEEELKHAKLPMAQVRVRVEGGGGG